MINKVRIRRFRSIDDLTVECDRITMIVGPNDAGKSNVVRALNLFFNGETDNGEKFEFEKDFNKFSNVPIKKAPQIEIEMTFDLPKSFISRNRSRVTWKKAWRREGEISVANPIRFSDGNHLPPRSKTPKHVQRHLLEYVPAIKDQGFFANLLGKIYDYLSQKASSVMVGDDLLRNTADLVGDLNQHLDNKFEISLPDNLRPIFENLTIKNEDGIPLSRRGDGIKIRHIPELLKFITELADKQVGIPNAVKPSHIWVFEEPENNLEINSAFKMVERLNQIMVKIPNLQIFITTHSPIFYGINRDVKGQSNLIRHFVDINGNFSFIKKIDENQINEKMGLMSLVSDTVNKYRKKLKESSERIKSMEDNGIDFSKPHLFVEGEDDKRVFQRALELYLPKFKNKLNIVCTENGSANSVINYLHAWQLQQQHRKTNQAKAYGLLDNDQGAEDAIKNLPSELDRKFIRHKKLDFVGTTLDMIKEQYKVTKDLESLYSDNFWQKAQSKEWLELISPSELVDKRLPTKIAEAIKSRNEGDPEVKRWETLSSVQRLRVEHKFTLDGKKRASKYLSTCDKKEAEKALKNVENELEGAIKWLFSENNQEELQI